MKPGMSPTWSETLNLPVEVQTDPIRCFAQANYRAVFDALSIDDRQVVANGHAFVLGEAEAGEVRVQTQIAAVETPEDSEYGFVTVHVLLERLDGTLVFGGHKSLAVRGGFSQQVFG